MGLSDSRHRRYTGYVFPPSVARFRSPPCRASQALKREAPRLIFPRALSPTTPEGPLAALACFFTSDLLWLHPSRRTGHLRLPIEAESGSLALRLTGSPPDSPAPLPKPTLVRLHVEQAIYMVNSFQFTRSARLLLASDREGALVGSRVFRGCRRERLRNRPNIDLCATFAASASARPCPGRSLGEMRLFPWLPEAVR